MTFIRFPAQLSAVLPAVPVIYKFTLVSIGTHRDMSNRPSFQVLSNSFYHLTLYCYSTETSSNNYEKDKDVLVDPALIASLAKIMVTRD